MKKIVVIAFMISLSALVSLAGCANEVVDTGEQGEGHPLEGSSNENYVMITFLSGIEYWKDAYRGFEEAGHHFGVQTQYTGASQYDINEQVTVFEQIVAQNPDGILLTAINPSALEEPINRAIEAGIPVITFDADSGESQRYSFLATSNYDAGVTAARELASLVGETGEVGVITVPGQQNHEDRTQGFVDTIETEFSKMDVVAIQDGESDQIAASNTMSGMIQSHPDLVGVFTTEASTGVGAGTAVQEANKVGDISIVSFDTDRGTLDMIKNGVIDATLAQGTWNMGYWGMNFLFHLRHDLLNPVSDWRTAEVSPLPTSVDTGVAIVNEDNVDYYYAD
ncbi:substrate-binding domain-containing protein [Caldalkalibacillus salinus]|uniref:substrate-binding domain-containing protein n=1 Tax=Caldalkalibacillus salinus TaxID=2803787 RepID=UPI001924418C|nr:substrate-binding domain-containing protein [Caldalkalibacillus salinus]